MKVLIVGANGFLGSEIVTKCLALGWEVWGAYNKSQEKIPLKCKKIRTSKLPTLKVNFDIIFIAVGNFTLSHAELIKANVLTTYRVSQLFKSAKLVFISSIAVYGVHKETIDENSSFMNPDIYGLAKITGEFIASSHTSFSIVRLTNLYGAGMVTKSFIPTIINDAFKEGVITLKNKTRMHDYLSSEDAANLCIKVGFSKINGIYLGATGKSVSNLKVAEIVQRITGCRINFQLSNESPSYFFNPKATMKELEWKAEKSIVEDLEKLVKFYESSNL